MSQGESLIVIILGVIAYLLYQIARQLTFLTGRKMRSPFSNMFNRPRVKSKSKPLEKEHLPN
jgi:hypothetical protein